MAKKELYLVEGYDPTVNYVNCNILALTPEACYQLDKKGIKYSILEDYYSEEDMLKGEENYFFSQLDWLESLNSYLWNNIGILQENPFKMPRIYYYFLKMAVDSLVIRSHILRESIEKAMPSHITYIYHKRNADKPDYTLFYRNRSLYQRLIPIVCKKYSVSLSFKQIDENNIAKEKNRSRAKNIIVQFKNIIKNNEFLLGLYCSCKYGLFQTRPARPHLRHRMKILILKGGYHIENLIKGALRNDCEVFLKRGKSILKLMPFVSRSYHAIKCRLGTESDPALKREFRLAAENLSNETMLLDWINQMCRLEVSDIILPRLQYFIRNVCPDIIIGAQEMAGFYDSENIDFVITTHEGYPEDYAMILACMLSRRTKSVHIQHGDSIFDLRWGITDLEHFDYYFSTNEEMARHFEGEKKSGLKYMHDCKCKIQRGSHRLKRMEYYRNKRQSRKGYKISKAKVFYLPTMLSWDHRYLNAPFYPDAWYYEFQKSLIEFFASRQDFNFIWKGLPFVDAVLNPIPNFIRDRKFSNITVSAAPFEKHLVEADRVILDFPSTGLYESVLAGIPTLALCHELFSIRSSASKLFGSIIRRFSSAQEAVKIVENFLDTDPHRFVTKLDIFDNNIVETLSMLKIEDERLRPGNRKWGTLGDPHAEPCRYGEDMRI